ncbi:unnamed protein product [Caenorhabditis auriculariae]|uniref:RBR-type E3 ubiquitin transferase n=1 Tax=Caenorhabditis auriculariae TaxID=2777116 RepID=A0A8S1H4W8_9PELO|nr:unnamed protein product [Caenorhabditis auriculariae]
MSSGKPSVGLGPLVECSEGVDPEDLNDTRAEHVMAERSRAIEDFRMRVRETPSKSGEGATSRRKKTGSRLSLVSLFSFTSSGGAAARERSRSGWSYGEEGAGTVTMSSVSASDIRVAVAGSMNSNKRYRGSDAGSCADGGSDHVAESLLAGEEETADEPLSEGQTVPKKKSTKAGKTRECPLCCMTQSYANFPRLLGCQHRSCRLCLMQYVELEIMENRVEISCPECPAFLHPQDIKKLVGYRNGLIDKYEQFSIRRYLLSEPEARWCPAPDCGYAVIASSCAACPQLKCERDGCGMLFCYHCKREWHANQTCDEARRTRGGAGISSLRSGRRITSSSIDAQLKPGDVKACPRCRTFIVKMDDGSCNHMVCAMCSAEFCWLCLKEISDLHYLSPTGCTFWGKKPWTRKKKLLWQLGTLIGAPAGIAFIAALSVPGIIFGVPVFVGRKVHQRFIHQSKWRRRILTAACFAGALFVSPVLAIMAVGVGVPIMLAYVYGVVPLSLCRNGGCGLSRSNSQAQFDSLDEEQLWSGSPGTDLSQLLHEERQAMEVVSLDPTNSMHSGFSSAEARGQGSLLVVTADVNRRRPSLESAVNSIEEKVNYEEASVKAMAGSHYYDDKSIHTLYSGHEAVSYTDEIASTKALAGSVIETKSLSESVGRHILARHADKSEEEHVFLCVSPSSTGDKKGDEQTPCSSSSGGSATRNKHYGVNRCQNADDFLLASEEGLLEISGASRGTNHSAFGGPGHGNEIEPDPFKIHALLDSMKQMVAADVPLEKSYEPTPLRPTGKLRRSGSGKSMLAIGSPGILPSPVGMSHASMPPPSNSDNISTAGSSSSKRRRHLGFFTSLFSRKK